MNERGLNVNKENKLFCDGGLLASMALAETPFGNGTEGCAHELPEGPDQQNEQNRIDQSESLF